MRDDFVNALVDRIYEAAVVTEAWPAVLQEIAEIGEGALASLLVLDHGGDLHWIGTPAADALVSEYVSLRGVAFNSRIPRRRRLPNPGFVGDLDYITLPEIDEDPFYQEFLHPRGYGWVAATHVLSPIGESMCVSVERRRTRGPFEREVMDRLDLFGPHLARAMLISSRLGLMRATDIADGLSHVGLPAAVLGHGAQPIAMNALFEALIPAVVLDGPGRLTLAAPQADKALAGALASLRSLDVRNDIRSVPLAAAEGRSPMIFHVLPIRGRAHDIFSLASAVVIVTPVVPAKVPSAELLQRLFELTPAEARVARAIGSGKTVNDIAAAVGLSRETVRTQLKAILHKTGLSRQAELASLLSGIAIGP
ncbi:MAG: helix-turn-helix transcriptional regulator [Pseudorhodoplanes sp.]|nr:helix-turn-helix transcriptional regulator [Pseudorhodoplanes sp.]